MWVKHKAPKHHESTWGTHLPHLRNALETLAASHLHWRAGSLRSFTAIRKEAGPFCGIFLRKGEVFAFCGLSQNLKDLKTGPLNFTEAGSFVS